MTDFFKSYSFKFWLFAFAIFLTRLPFLSSGYGLDEDSWSVAMTAKDIAATGQVEVSRFPGYPVQEFICSLFYNGYPFRLNLLTAVISTIGFLFFAMTLRVWKFKHIFLAAAALAFTRVVYINSTTTIDYLWALAFLLISLYYVARNKLFVAGIFLGVAVGCRITSGAMIIPYSIMMMQTDGLKKNIVRIFKLAFPAVVVGCLLYLPIYLKYGWQFFSYYDIFYPSIFKVLYKFFAEVWGVIGLIGLITAIVFLFSSSKNKTRKYLFPRSINEKYVIAWLIAIDIYIILFLRFPVESGYLIPIVPFTIFIFGKYLYDRAFKFFAITLILSSFIFSINPADRDDAATPSPVSFVMKAGGENLNFDVNGSIFTYESRRKNGLKFTDKILKSLDTLKSRSLIVAGIWYDQIALKRSEASVASFNTGLYGKPPVEFRYYITQDSLLYYIGKGYSICYLPRQDINNLLIRKVNIAFYGAEPYVASEKLSR